MCSLTNINDTTNRLRDMFPEALLSFKDNKLGNLTEKALVFRFSLIPMGSTNLQSV